MNFLRQIWKASKTKRLYRREDKASFSYGSLMYTLITFVIVPVIRGRGVSASRDCGLSFHIIAALRMSEQRSLMHLPGY